MPAVSLYWNRCKDEAWADLEEVDLEDDHFHGFEGVYIIWHGGQAPHAVAVGQGKIRDKLVAARADPTVASYKSHSLFVSWARVEKVLRDGVERFLIETARPKSAAASKPEAALIEANLPGKPPPAGLPAAPPEKTRPKVRSRDMLRGETDDILLRKAAGEASPTQPAPAAAAAPTPKAQPSSRLQAGFDGLLAERAKTPKSGGLFGGGSAAKPKDDDGFVQQVVQLILTEGVGMGASDIHLEPQDGWLRVRFRIDGIMEQVLRIPESANVRVVSYIRVACGLDPEKSVGMAKPEDGRMAVNVSGKEADLRLSTFPTSSGDKAVLRIIPRNITVPRLGELGLPPTTVKVLDELIRRPQGMIIVTGPTGSGKSTTLYTALQTLNEPSRNIVTLEDPIEKKIPGISQGALQPKAGFNFTEGLRAILRQDPNIIMVGEIRDLVTAEVAMSAALTGHMLFTTLHTNSALGAINRLMDMGLEPFLIAAALTALTAQRLVRRVCPTCSEAHPTTPEELAELEALARRGGVAVPEAARKTLFRGKGCAECRESGYAGRVLIFEFIRVTHGLRQLILKKAGGEELRACALKDGSETLLLDGLRKTAEGQTTLAELTRVVGSEE